MEEITKWYADKIGKTPDEFDAIDKHIETVIQTWEKERNQALTIPVVVNCKHEGYTPCYGREGELMFKQCDTCGEEFD